MVHNAINGATIRRARAGDAAAMRGCVDAAYAHYVERIGKRPGPMLDDYAAVTRSPLAFVQELQGALTGLVVLIDRPEGLLLDNVAVHPDYAGRGLGRQLIEFAEAKARALGSDALDLYTHELMHENIALYTRLGYIEIARRHEHGFARVYMRKHLG